MRLQVLFPVILILLPFLLHAQEMLSMGVRGSFGGSDIIARAEEGNYSYLYSPNLSYALAGFIDLKLSKYNKYLGVVIEPGYCLKGAIHQDSLKRKMHYASLVGLFRVQPNKNIYMAIGPELSYLIRANHKVDDISTNRTQHYNVFEYGAVVEAGYWFSMEWYLGLRYGLALKKMTERPYDDNGTTVQIREYNHYLHLSLRLRLYEQSRYGR